ncbi:MarR family transcriptional regulator [Paracoccus sp. MBLB3053]|uniref:MarR family transcriptional regulator n=1 Tax=Paracoccus aurantius TaxID=3073814 RepID=A0ABU2HVZ8_9RHOB|nr:MarR family transcriptional regulator [Paracoccus sp. MBLB3053]MDS9469227.1 MarR family transcriptional regulator [Paracoccus sp. MBLB3053]
MDQGTDIALEDRTKLALTALRQILRSTENNSKAVMRETGLTPSQLVFMHLLEEAGEQTAGFIAGRMGITQATMTVLIHKLENLGIVRRRKGEHDRRQSWLSLTDHGRALLAIAPDGSNARFHQQFAALDGWEQLMLISALERVAAMLALPVVDEGQPIEPPPI